MKKIKILQVIPSLELAGAENMCTNLSIELSKNVECEVKVISLYNIKTNLTKKLETNDIEVFFLDKRRGLDLRLIYKINKIIKEFQPDIIHTHLYSLTYIIPATFGIKKKVKIVHTIHNIANKDGHKILRIIQGHYFRKNIIKPVSIADNITSSISEIYGIASKNISMIYNGVELKNCIKKENYNLNSIILHIGRFEEAKNHVGIINSFSKVVEKFPNIKLQLIGDGSLKDSIKALVKNLELEKNVEFIGLVDNVFPYLNKSDIFIFPSKYEGMPMTIIEAMGTGLPIIASAVGGIPNMIKNDYSGILVEDDTQLSNKIIEMLLDKDMRQKYGKNALIESKKFSSENMSNSYIKLYNKQIRTEKNK